MEQKTNYQVMIETHYNAVLGIFRHFITQFADESVEIAARAVALAAPLPNAINMYNVAMRDLGYSSFASFAFALTLEIVVFLLVEVALKLWDGYLVKPGRFRYPFYVAIGIVLLATAVVMGIVYVLEPHKIMAFLPIVSLCSFVGIGLKRWDARNHDGGKKPAKSVKPAKIVKADSKPDSHERIILNHYMVHPLDSQRVAAESLGMNQAKVNRTLKQLESKGVIHRNGNGVEILREL